jgi:hypothetical protein
MTDARLVTSLARLLSVTLCLILSGCVAGNLAMEAQIRQYSGDGAIHSCSNALGPGYVIEFPKFDASRPCAASYRVSHVPRLQRIDGPSNAGFYLRFKSNLGFAATRELKKKSTAVLRLTIVDSRGEVIQSSKSAVSDSGWTQTQNVYSVSDGEFHFDADASYILKVVYTPGPVAPPAKELYFAIDNCAWY